MKRQYSRFMLTVILTLFLISVFSCDQKDQRQITKDALQEFQEIKFGMFIHFGLYALPGGVWKGDTLSVGTIAEHIMRIKSIPRNEYRQLASEFNPYAFNAKEIVNLAKQAGMKYIVITAKHHDGFAMFDSDYDNYNIKDGTPYGKDLLAELSEECKKQGVRLGLYYSHTRDWDEYHSIDRNGNNWDWDIDDPDRNLQIYLDAKVKPQLTELLTNYGDIFCLWFDTPGDISEEQARDLYNLVKELQPDCLINSRIGTGLGDYGVMGDNQIPPGVASGAWESPATMNHTWGYHHADNKWKSSKHMITQLVDLSSKSINYLLNIGPKADGSIPQESLQRLKDIGEWTMENGEAIYKTGPSPWFQEMDGFRITTGEEVLYLTLLNPEMEFITLYNIENEIIKVEGLLNGVEIPFEYKMLKTPDISMLNIRIPEELRNEILPVIKVFIKGTPDVQDQPTQMSTGDVLLQAGMANIVRIDGEVEVFGIGGTLDVGEYIGEWPYFATRNWDSEKDYLEWDFNLIEPGQFNVHVINVSTVRRLSSYLTRWESIYQKPEDFNRVSFNVNNQIVSGQISETEPIQHIRSEHRPEFANSIGIIKIEKPGTYTAVLKAEFINPLDNEGLVIYEVRLEKISL